MKKQRLVATKKQTKQQQAKALAEAIKLKVQKKQEILKAKNDALVEARRKYRTVLQKLLILINEKAAKKWTPALAVSLFSFVVFAILFIDAVFVCPLCPLSSSLSSFVFFVLFVTDSFIDFFPFV